MRKLFRFGFNQAGTNLKAVCIRDPDLILADTYYYVGVDTEEEMLYGCSILHSKTLKNDVKEKGNERHLGMKPLEYDIPKFDKNNPLHMEIVKIGQNLEKISQMAVDVTEKEKLSEMKNYLNKNNIKYELNKNDLYYPSKELIIANNKLKGGKDGLLITDNDIVTFLGNSKEWNDLIEDLDELVVRLLL